ncbi:MAG: enoyl-CoA hydratase/isomerase family protein [Chloroflexi bacterium]|nr:enoyl-CoA hydratase/isomerase family protein [Chloroflexota bacterium]
MIATTHNDLIFEIKLNRPEKRNAMTIQMLMELAGAVAEAERTGGVRLIVVRGEGKMFSAGLDLMSMGGAPEEFGDDWMHHSHEVSRAWQACLNRLANASLPSLALIHSYAIGVGLELALACDLRYAAPDVRLSLEETRVGLIPDVGGTTRLTGLIGPGRAKEMIYTARRIDAETAERWGLVNRVVAYEEFDSAAMELVEEISGCSPLAVSAAKRVIQGILDEQRGMTMEASEIAPLFHTEDLQIGAQATMMKQKPEWKWK